MSDDLEDEPVGYRRPPKATRFRKGQSGNPGGRPKARCAAEIDAEALLDQPMTVRVDGAPREMHPNEICLRKVLDRALNKQDLRAINYLLELFVKHGGIELPTQTLESQVVIIPNDVPFKLGVKAAETYGAPPWSDKELAPLKKDYLEARTELEAIEDGIMEYEL